jgi:hypothetical protein
MSWMVSAQIHFIMDHVRSALRHIKSWADADSFRIWSRRGHFAQVWILSQDPATIVSRTSYRFQSARNPRAIFAMQRVKADDVTQN